jgi:hypothetical protein
MIADAQRATCLVKAMCVLHNYLRKTEDPTYCPPGFADSVDPSGNITNGFWRAAQSPLDELNIASRSMTTAASEIRNRLVTYFSGPGSVSWQENHVNQR